MLTRNRILNSCLSSAPWIAALVLLAAGCSESGIPRAEVHGKVTLDGKPIPQGDIRFVPTSGPVWSAKIKDGIYTTAGTKGVPVGQLRVEIQAFRTPPNFTLPADGSGDGIPMEQYLPAKFNLESKLEMTIEPGASSVEKNFELTK
jgi:hypothetical protein